MFEIPILLEVPTVALLSWIMQKESLYQKWRRVQSENADFACGAEEPAKIKKL